MQAQPTTLPAAGRATHGNARPKPRRKGSTDGVYWIARNFATLHVYLTPETLVKEMDISLGAAHQLIQRLRDDSVLGPPDMFGVYALARANESELARG